MNFKTASMIRPVDSDDEQSQSDEDDGRAVAVKEDPQFTLAVTRGLFHRYLFYGLFTSKKSTCWWSVKFLINLCTSTARIVTNWSVTSSTISSGSSGRVRGGARNMKSMRPPSAAIFFMTYFHRARGGHGPLGPPPGSATDNEVAVLV